MSINENTNHTIHDNNDDIVNPQKLTQATKVTVHDIYTQAAGGNFDFDFNARTGRLEGNIILGTVSSGFASPVTFNYTMSLGVSQYYGANTLEEGKMQHQFGLNIPRMSVNGVGRAHFSSGLVDNISGQPSSLSLEMHRELDVKIESVSTMEGGGQVQQGFVVTHINGIVEYYDSQGRIKEMRSESGHGLKFTITHDPWLNMDIISRVQDDEGMNWVATEMVHAPSSDESERYMNVIQHIDGVTITTRVVLGSTSNEVGVNNNFFVQRISLPNDMLHWININYDQTEDIPAGSIIRKVTLPTGTFISVAKQSELNFSDTHVFPVGIQVLKGSQTQGVERVLQTINYSYSTNNFTGYKEGRAMVSMVDNCLLLTEDYNYTVTASHAKSRVRTMYNRFHLPVSTRTEEIGRGRTTFQRVATYYSYPIVEGDISEQPANFSRWISMIVDHEEVELATGKVIKSRRTQASRTFDVYGNLLTQILPSGIREEYTYYDKDSCEEGGCPSSPNFVRFLHTKTIRAKGGLQDPTGGLQTEFYTYATVAGMPYTSPLDAKRTVSTSMILRKTDAVNDVIMANYQYVNEASTPFLLGALRETSSSYNGVENKTLISWVLSEYKGMRIIDVTSYIWATGLATSTFAGSAKFSPMSGLVYEEEDSARSITAYVYDSTCRLKQIKKHYNTQFEEVTCYDVHYWGKSFRDDVSTPVEYRGLYTNRVTITSPTGKVTCTHLDHEGEPVFISHADDDDFSQVASVTLYDRSNGTPEVIQQQAIDYVATSPTDQTPRQLKAITTYEHRLFGTCKVVYPDNTALNFDVDKAGTPFTQTSYADATPNIKHVQKFNDFGDVYETHLTYPEGGTSQTVVTSSKLYDGYGRIVQLMENGTTTTFSYDKFNRLTSQVCAEESTSYTYDSHLASLAELSRIQASFRRNGGTPINIMDASRVFDNFGRIVEQREPNNGASGGNSVVKTIRYKSPTELAPSSVSNGRGWISYDHDVTTGLLTMMGVYGLSGVKHREQEHFVEYDPVSKMISSVRSREKDPDRGYLDTVSHRYTYNDFGATKLITSMFGINPIGATIRNGFSKFSSTMEKMEVLDHRNNIIYTEHHLYDSIGRLTRKEFTISSGLSFYATIAYSVPDVGSASSGHPIDIRIADKATQSDILRISFSYDQFGNESDRRVRLVSHDVEHETLTFNQVSKHDGNAQSRTLAFDPGFNNPRASETIRYEYTPSQKYLQMSTMENSWRTYSVRYENTAFSAVNNISYQMPGSLQNIDFSRSYDQVSQMNNHVNGNEVRNFGYDDNGNVAFISSIDDYDNTKMTMTYNALNQLLKLSKNGLDVARYGYDFFGKLVKTSDIVKNRTRCLLYGVDGLMGEIGDFGDEVARTFYINVGGVSVGRYVQKNGGKPSVLELFATDNGGTVYAVCKYINGQLNLRELTRLTYSDDGFRSNYLSDDQLNNPIGFKGYFIDAATGCYVLGDGFRLYDPIMRQFWSADSLSPFGEAGPNRYQYCGMDPVNRADHSGNDWSWKERLNQPRWQRWLASSISISSILKNVAEEVVLADSASRTDPTKGDYYIPKAAIHFDHIGEGLDLVGFFVGNLAGSAVPKPTTASKLGQGVASAVTAGSRAGTTGSRLSGLSSVASGGKHATSGASRSFPGVFGRGSNIRSTLQKHAATGGFKAYPVTLNGRLHTVHLSKVRTNGSRVSKQMMSSYSNGPHKSIHTLSGAHGQLNGRVGAKARIFLLEDVNSANLMQQLAAKYRVPTPQISHTNIGQRRWQANGVWVQEQLLAEAGKADEVIYAFCHSGLNNQLRAQLGIKRVWAPWRWWGPA